jgi:hypothetical protein
MTPHHCHDHAAQTTGRHTSPSSDQQPTRAARSFSWLIPTAILALLPKCPLCIAAWMAVAGLSLSLSTLTNLRTALIILCVISLIAFAAATLRRLIPAHR